ncbi:hypothetical protein GYMLUDRAFT_36202 [Collybiopsis luxurians FD-317 M1]|nr:hypothetical protein GYMLUDRAFT_36202 [Collybiopsis luxurians FD-317 M1]
MRTVYCILLLGSALPALATQIVFNDHQAGHWDRESFHNIDWDSHRWVAPGEDDLRSPCPGMNILANHGFLPRDGRNVTIPMTLKAIDGKDIPRFLHLAMFIRFPNFFAARLWC